MRARLLASSQPRQGQDSDVIVLAKLHCCVRCHCSVGGLSKELIKPLETEHLAARAASLEQAVGIEREVIPFAKIKFHLLIGRSADHSQGQRTRQLQLSFI